MEDFIRIIGLVVISACIIILAAVLFGFPTMWLWNYLMPSLFGLVQISLWKAICINIFCGILFRPSTKTSNNE